MATRGLGTLLAQRRKQAGMSQADLAGFLPGFTRSAVNSIEQGATKSLSPDVANEIVKVLPVTMAELVRAMGYELPVQRSALGEDATATLESAPTEVLDAVRLVLNGWRAQQRSLPASGEVPADGPVAPGRSRSQ